MNEEMEVAETRKKEELKQWREAAGQEQTQSSWKRSKHVCHFAGWSKGAWSTTSGRSTAKWHRFSDVALTVGTYFISRDAIIHPRFERNKSPTQRTT